MKTNKTLLLKIILMGILTLLMLIPLALVMKQVDERRHTLNESVDEVSSNWGRSQNLAGPVLSYSFYRTVKNRDGEPVEEEQKVEICPETLRYDIETETTTLHRSLYDIPVYRARVRIDGSFPLPAEGSVPETVRLSLGVSDLRGLEGNLPFTLGSLSAAFTESENGRIFHDVPVARLVADAKDGLVPFTAEMTLKGSQYLQVKPYGALTEVSMRGDCPSPSFCGDFLPSEREVGDQGFSARWVVSKVNRDRPESTQFGVRMINGVSAYQQTTRSAKYGILIILLVFIAGLAVEWVTRKEINLVQYVVIGLSLVLFYALLLSFSEFMRFGTAYLLAAGLTVTALTGYFRGILRDRTGWLLGALVALMYLVNYVLLQMETYALLTGTLILFALLCGIMYFTRNLTRSDTQAI